MKGCLFWERKHERKNQRNLNNMLIAGVFVIILIKKLESARVAYAYALRGNCGSEQLHEGRLASQTKKTCVVFSEVQHVYLTTQKLL